MSSDVSATKFYVRHREGAPDSELTAYAHLGFRTLGIETAPYEWIDDINGMADLGPNVGIAGFLGDVHAALEKLGKPVPPGMDYPEPLKDFLGRKIWASTLGEVREWLVPVFVKSQATKAFTGFVWQGLADQASRMRVVTQHDEMPVWVADVVDFVAEYRAFILFGQVIGCRFYKGNWSKAPNRGIIEKAVKAMGKNAPKAYALDWGVTADGFTLLIEGNDAFSLGHYGLPPVSYARMLSARWHELTR